MQPVDIFRYLPEKGHDVRKSYQFVKSNMKFSIKAFLAIAVMGIVAVSCGKVEKILPKKDGLWNQDSFRMVGYLNDSLLSDTTVTDSLGVIYFNEDGTGYTQDEGSTSQSAFTWSVNDDNDVLTITDSDSGSVPMPMDILESSSKAMTLFNSTTTGAAPAVTKIEMTLKISR